MRIRFLRFRFPAFGCLIDQHSAAVRVFVEADIEHHAHGQQEAEARQELTHPDAGAEEIEGIGPQPFDPEPAQAVPGQVLQEGLAVVPPLLGQAMQQHEADQIPDGLIEEGGVPVAEHTEAVRQPHAQKEIVEDLRAVGLPIEEVSPAADALADQQAQGHDVQIGAKLLLFQLGEEQQAQDGADDAAVDGDAALPDVEG